MDGPGGGGGGGLPVAPWTVGPVIARTIYGVTGTERTTSSLGCVIIYFSRRACIVSYPDPP